LLHDAVIFIFENRSSWCDELFNH